MVVVLKPRHSLLGKSLIPVLAQLRAIDSLDGIESVARLKKEHPLENYSINELHQEFEKLTGETVKDTVPLTGKPDDINTARMLLHFAILQANIVGAPKGQGLSVSTTTSSGAAVAPVSVDLPAASSATSSDGGRKRPIGELEDRINAVEDSLQSLKDSKKEIQVEDALRHIRILASRPGLTTSQVLIAAIETLVEVATRAGSKDVDCYVKSLSYCRKYESSEDLCGLVLKLFGSTEDKRIASAVSDWAKHRKYEGPVGSLSCSKTGQPFQGMQGQPQYFTTSAHLAGVPTPQFNGMPGLGFEPFPMYPNMFPYPSPSVRGRGRGRSGQGNRGPPSCFYCKEPGHLVSQCPKLKTEDK